MCLQHRCLGCLLTAQHTHCEVFRNEVESQSHCGAVNSEDMPVHDLQNLKNCRTDLSPPTCHCMHGPLTCWLPAKQLSCMATLSACAHRKLAAAP